MHIQQPVQVSCECMHTGKERLTSSVRLRHLLLCLAGCLLALFLPCYSPLPAQSQAVQCRRQEPAEPALHSQLLSSGVTDKKLSPNLLRQAVISKITLSALGDNFDAFLFIEFEFRERRACLGDVALERLCSTACPSLPACRCLNDSVSDCISAPLSERVSCMVAQKRACKAPVQSPALLMCTCARGENTVKMLLYCCIPNL